MSAKTDPPPATTSTFRTKRFLPVLAELIPRADGTFILRPIIPDDIGDTWLPVSQAADVIGIKPQSLYPLLGVYLVYRRPLRSYRLVSLRSALRYRDATRDPDFWDNLETRAKLKSEVATAMRQNLSF